ncbi:DUF7344 domain-containing protein [Natrarchaeobius halalkaliphilus]
MGSPSTSDGSKECITLETNEDCLSPSAAFELLADQHRRYFLHYFRVETTRTAETEEVCEFIVNGLPDSDTDKDSLQIELRHQHLPRLTQCNIIEYDNRHETVRYYSDPVVEQCLEFVSSHDLG